MRLHGCVTHMYVDVLYTPQAKFDYVMNKCNDLNAFERHAESADFAVSIKREIGHRSGPDLFMKSIPRKQHREQRERQPRVARGCPCPPQPRASSFGHRTQRL